MRYIQNPFKASFLKEVAAFSVCYVALVFFLFLSIFTFGIFNMKNAGDDLIDWFFDRGWFD